VADVLSRLEALGDTLSAIDPGATASVFVVTGTLPEADPAQPPVVRVAEDPQLAIELGVDPVCSVGGDPVVPASRLHALAFPVDHPSPRFVELELGSACADDYGSIMQRVADRIAEQVEPICMPACVVDEDDETPGLQVDCRLTVKFPDGEGGLESHTIPRCEGVDELIPEGALGCWASRTDDALHPECAELGWNLELTYRWDGPFPAGGVFEPRCRLSEDKPTDCPGLP
jgi:hypothetical protein